MVCQVDLGQQERRVVRKEEAEEFGRLNGLKYFETSAVRHPHPHSNHCVIDMGKSHVWDRRGLAVLYIFCVVSVSVCSYRLLSLSVYVFVCAQLTGHEVEAPFNHIAQQFYQK